MIDFTHIYNICCNICASKSNFKLYVFEVQSKKNKLIETSNFKNIKQLKHLFFQKSRKYHSNYIVNPFIKKSQTYVLKSQNRIDII